MVKLHSHQPSQEVRVLTESYWRLCSSKNLSLQSLQMLVVQSSNRMGILTMLLRSVQEGSLFPLHILSTRLQSVTMLILTALDMLTTSKTCLLVCHFVRVISDHFVLSPMCWSASGTPCIHVHFLRHVKFACWKKGTHGLCPTQCRFYFVIDASFKSYGF